MKKISHSIIYFLILVLLAVQTASAQTDTKKVYLPGFDKGISGVDFNYRSPLPQNEDAYILRNSFANREMTWKTAPLTQSGLSGKVAFIFMAAMSTDSRDLKYQLKVNDGEVFNFTNNQDKVWLVKGSLGGELSFYQAKSISGVELNGFMILTIQANRIKTKEPVELKVTLLPTTKNSWIIIFKKALQNLTTITSSPVLVRENGEPNQQVVISQIQFREPGPITFSSGGKVLFTSQTKIGFNQFYVPVPAVKSAKKVTILASNHPCKIR
ncbi:MAG: hypothetical protein NTV01_10340 [Bacteroidia bacterium]|nr:hypothetical protein [Bacteroidia bacterium]